MSFFNNFQHDRYPGHIRGNPLNGLCERVCVQVKRVFDACRKQVTEENVVLRINDIRSSEIVAPYTFINAKSISSHGNIENLSVIRLNEKSRYARVQCDVNIPLEVIFIDEEDVEYKGYSYVTVHEDVVLHIPKQSIIPFGIEAVANVICPDGRYLDECRFSVTECATVVLEVVAETELLVPCYGYCPIPPAQDFSKEVCAELCELPLFPRSGN